jgi:hypothetical protein
MPYPTIKSDPWKKRPGRKPRRKGFWPPDAWKRLTKQAAKGEDMAYWRKHHDISPNCLRLIAEFDEFARDN